MAQTAAIWDYYFIAGDNMPEVVADLYLSDRKNTASAALYIRLSSVALGI